MNALFNATKIKNNDVYQTHTSESAFPTAPFPGKYVHCVFDDGSDAVQAVLTLVAAGYNATSIYVLTSQDYLNALEHRQTLFGYLTSFDMNEYRREANRGHTMLVIRPESYGQLGQIRDLLIPHRTHLMRYIDTWTITELLA